MNTKQMMWKFLIQKGYNIESRSYYGNSTSVGITREWRDNVSSGDWITLIDWGKTSEVKDNTYDRFAGTFVESDTIKVLEGVMYTIEGTKLEWELNLEDEDLASLILSVLTSANE